jgi:hypothetical protein
MANKINTIPAKVRELLDAVTEEFGIEVIKEYIELYRQRRRKLMKHHNTKEDVAYDVYKLMFNSKYNRARAIDEIAIKRNIKYNTINNHLNSFNQKAKEKNFYTIGFIIDKIYDYCKNNFECISPIIKSFAEENNLENRVLKTYYWKYKTLTEREKSKFEINLKNLKLPEKIKDLVSNS